MTKRNTNKILVGLNVSSIILNTCPKPLSLKSMKMTMSEFCGHHYSKRCLSKTSLFVSFGKLYFLYSNRRHRKFTVSSSESCNPSTAAKKKTTYSEAKNVIAFKIDVRIVCCYNGVNYELVNGEAACHSGDDKIVQDEGKLTREGKDIQDCFVENQCSTLFPFMLQLVGPSIDISTLHLTAPGLYISLPRYNVALPASIPELEKVVPDLLVNLLTLRVST